MYSQFQMQNKTTSVDACSKKLWAKHLVSQSPGLTLARLNRNCALMLVVYLCPENILVTSKDSRRNIL